MSCFIMLRYVMLRYVTLCYVMLRYVTLCYVTLRYVTLGYVMLCYVKGSNSYYSNPSLHCSPRTIFCLMEPLTFVIC